jgi:hypothetical protein
MTRPIKTVRIMFSVQNQFKRASHTDTRDKLCLSVYHTPWLAAKDRYACPSSTSYCSKLSRSERERHDYKCHWIPLLRIKTVIYSDLVGLSQMIPLRHLREKDMSLCGLHGTWHAQNSREKESLFTPTLFILKDVVKWMRKIIYCNGIIAGKRQ